MNAELIGHVFDGGQGYREPHPKSPSLVLRVWLPIPLWINFQDLIRKILPADF